MPDQQPTRKKKVQTPVPEIEQAAPPAAESPDAIELKQLREAFASIAPGLNRIQALVAAGWLKASPTNLLIDSLIEEITLLRAERLVPPVNPSLSESFITAFSVMSDKLRLNLHNTEKTVQQMRYDAFQAGVEMLLPILLSKGRLEGYQLVQGILANDINDLNRVLGYFESAANLEPTVAAARDRQRDILKGQLDTTQRLNGMIQQLINGGVTPEQAIQAADAARAQRAEAAGVPPGATVN